MAFIFDSSGRHVRTVDGRLGTELVKVMYDSARGDFAVNGSPVTELAMEKRLPHGGLLQRHGGTVNIRWLSGGSLAVTQVFDSLSYSFLPSAAEAPKVSGLLGKGDGSGYRLTGRDGSMIGTSDSDFAAKLYEHVGNSWRI